MSSEGREPRRPNVIFILSDDQGPWAAGCCGNSEIRTPNIDRLAETGTRFSKFFVSTPVCSPSRANFLTGRISSQTGIHEWISKGNVGPDAEAFTAGEVAYTDVMAENGYNCGLSGKWHLGDSATPQHGMSFWYAHQAGGGPYNDAPMVRDGQLIDEPGYITDVITDEALRFLDRQGGTPFCLNVHYTAPHAPWTGHPQEIVDSYDDCPFESCPQEPAHPWAIPWAKGLLGNREALKGYFAAVTAMDLNIGRIIDRVEQLGLREETLIVFVSDNGFSCGHRGFWGKGNGTHPRNMYENSVLVPAVFSQPGAIPQSRVTDAMVTAYDLLPSLMEHCKLPAPEGRNLPGTSFAPALRGEAMPGNESVVIYDEYGPVRMIRTHEWKYVYRHPGGPNELYDLARDPGERTNLVDEAKRRALIGDLKRQMDEWFTRYVIPERDGLRETY